MSLLDIGFVIAAVIFTAATLLVLYRIVRGPTILDRVIASDVLLTTLILVLGAEMAYNRHTRSLPIMFVIAAIAIFSTVTVAKFVSKQDRR